MKNNTTKAMIYVMIITMIAKGTGFLRETIIAAYFGAGAGTDAYFVAQTLPMVLFAVIGASMGEVFIPIYMERYKYNRQEANQFANSVINISLLVTSVLSLMCMLISPYIIKFLAPGFSGEVLDMASYMLIIMVFSFSLTSLSYMLTGILQSQRRHIIPALISVPSNAIIIVVTIIFADIYSINILAWSSLLGIVAQIILQWFFVSDIYKYRPYIDINAHVKRYFLLLFPVVLGKAVDEVNYIIDKILASTLQPGSISAINYTTKLVNFGAGIVISGLVLVLYPIFSQLSIEREYRKLSDSIVKAVQFVVYAVVPITLIAYIYSDEIVRLVFQRGMFGDKESEFTAYVFRFYILGIGAICLREVLNRGFFAIQDTKRPMKLGIGAMLLNVCLNVILVRKIGIAGLGVATTVSNILLTFMLYYYLKKSIGYYESGILFDSMLNSFIAAFVTGVVMYITKSYYSRYCGVLLSLIVNSLLGVSIYILVLYKRRRIHAMGSKQEYIDLTKFSASLPVRAPVSVIIPCYCCVETIEKVVQSVWMQTWRPYEVILVEDCSPDGGATRTLLKNIRERYSDGWIKLLFLNKNSGPGNARNKGWEMSTQRYIAFLDSDDIWHPQKIEVQLKCMLSQGDICIAAHPDTVIGGFDLDLEGVPIYNEELKNIRVRNITPFNMLIRNLIYTSSVMIDKTQVPYRFKPDKYYSEDYLLWLSIILPGKKAMRIELPLYYVWEDLDKVSLSRQLWKMEQGEMKSYRSIYRAGLINWPTYVLLKVFSFGKYIKRLIAYFIERTVGHRF